MGSTTYTLSYAAGTSGKRETRTSGVGALEAAGYTEDLERDRIKAAGSGLQSVDSTSTSATFLNSDGQFSLLTSLNTVDAFGFFMDLGTVFTIYVDETGIADVLDNISSQQMSIISEITAYNYTGFDEGNKQITIYSIGYNGLGSPTITGPSDETILGLVDYSKYTVTMNNNEVSDLRDKFGYPVGSSIEQQIESGMATIAAEVYNSYTSKREVFKRVPRQKIYPADYGNISPIFATASVAPASTAATTSTTTSTSRGY